jgi:hypothetical protein
MRKVTKYQTCDCEEHLSMDDALRHLDKVYGDKLCKIGHELVKCDGKYSKMTEFIDNNLHLFEELSKIKSDMTLDDIGCLDADE